MTAKYRTFAAAGTPAQVDAELALHMDPIADAPTVTGAHIGKLAEYPGTFLWSRVQVRGLFPTAEAAAVAVARYVRNWPPEGYGTSLTVREVGPEAWAVQGSRMASCD